MILLLEEHKNNPAYMYAIDVVNEEFPVNVDVKKVCKQFIDDMERNEDDDYEFWFDFKLVNLITAMTKLINMASGVKAGEPVQRTSRKC